MIASRKFKKSESKQINGTSDKVINEQFVLGFLPTDLSFSLSQLMAENRNYFKIGCRFSELGKTDSIDISVDLLEHILKDHKIKDSKIQDSLHN